ncbi:response regulator [Burkholderiaceae bacterium DAT-1]|nr:response regulator [Burkholderiaceae bacterium DAT-1]
MYPPDLNALVVDDAITVRQSVRMMLGQLGITKTESASNAGEARRRIQNGRYDIILCDYHFGPGMTGQELLEDLRHSGVLPLDAIFIMITAEASYERVVAVAEVAPDDYILKPFTADQIDKRLQRAWQKRVVMAEVHAAIGSGKINDAIGLAHGLLARHDVPFRSEITRFLTRMLTEAGRHEEAAQVCEQILRQRGGVPWARLGLAKYLERCGREGEAEAMLAALIAESSVYVDAYDALAQHYTDRDEHDAALEVIERSLKVTPNNIHRLQGAGMSSYLLGDAENARKYLERAVAHGANSASLQPRALFCLILSSVSTGKTREAEKSLALLRGISERRNNFETEVLIQYANVLLAGVNHQQESLQQFLLGLDTKVRDQAFTLDLASDCLETLSAFESSEPVIIETTRRLAMRFANQKRSVEHMEQAARKSPVLLELIKDCVARINQLANQGMMLVMKGNLEEAARHLYNHAMETCNARLLLAAANACIKAAQGSDHPRRAEHLLKQASDCVTRLAFEYHDPTVLDQLERDMSDAMQALKTHRSA